MAVALGLGGGPRAGSNANALTRFAASAVIDPLGVGGLEGVLDGVLDLVSEGVFGNEVLGVEALGVGALAGTGLDVGAMYML